MAYSYKNSKGTTYFLHGKMVTLRGGRKQQIYYFAKAERKADAVAEMPAGYMIVESKKTKLPILKKK
jgi:hypothetical protein